MKYNSNIDKINNIKASLKERVKELECLYNILQISVDKQNCSLEEIFMDILEVLPRAWQYPEISSAKIVFDDLEYLSVDYITPKYKQESDIIVEGQKRGFVEISYSEETVLHDEGPFLKEERALINSIARKLALIIIRNEEKRENKILESRLIHADRLATIGELTAGIAHELNEPLGSILGFAQLIKKESSVNSQVKMDLDKIINASMHAREIIRKLMTFSKYDEKGSEKVCLNTILTDGIYLLESRCEKENINVVKTLEEHLPSVFANPVQLNQVVVNLCVNSIQAMSNGGKLILQTFSNEESVILVVQDTGSGISEDHLPKIFNPFFTTKDSNTNTGLGLSVVHGIVKSCNGIIKVESNLGVGTRFEIALPIMI